MGQGGRSSNRCGMFYCHRGLRCMRQGCMFGRLCYRLLQVVCGDPPGGGVPFDEHCTMFPVETQFSIAQHRS